MDDETKTKLGVPANHTLVQTDWSAKQRKGRDIDYWSYDELDENGTVVVRYSVIEDMDIYTQKTDFSFTRSEVTTA
ncbi:MAG: hypothetical protein EOP52_13875 [Sphingobacteriales bacterium]|nr:MAG: hypothetical protein EOP52_13875 [Sphingobacteriales bacterium]